MAVDFSRLQLGAEYDRPSLARLWGYAGFQAISRGVVTPSGQPYIILFVTEQKQESLTQYNDYFANGKLHWEGEKRHGSDRRIVDAGIGPDEIHLFHRKIHHTPFVYCGRVYLEQHSLRIDEPSQFIFCPKSLDSEYDLPQNSIDNNVDDISPERRTEQAAIYSSRRGQGVFRDGLLRLWGGCAISGYHRNEVLIASHIKPWKVASDNERLDPYNGLLLSLIHI